MRILRPGGPAHGFHSELIFNCPRCGCEFSAMRHECRNMMGPKFGHRCPECGIHVVAFDDDGEHPMGPPRRRPPRGPRGW